MFFDSKVFAERLKIVRDDIPATQAELADKLHVTRQTISLYEKGERVPDIEFLYDLSALTSVSPAYFLGFVDAKDARGVAAASIGLTESSVHILQELSMFKPHLSSLLNKLLADASFHEILNHIAFHHYVNPLSFGLEYGKFSRYQAHSALDELIKRVESEQFTPTHTDKNSLEITTQNYNSVFDDYCRQLKYDLRDMEVRYTMPQPQNLDSDKFSKYRSYRQREAEKQYGYDTSEPKTIKEYAEEIDELAKHIHVDNRSMF